jgi:tetratricopeptide (TPR) repeat protein
MLVARAAAPMLCALVSALCLQLSAQTPAPSPAPKKAPPAAPSRISPPPRGPASQLRALPSLGAVAFPNSGAPGAQSAFLRGVAWLHSFGYEEAIDAFREAQKIDAGFAMAYWGEAMSFNQPLWFHEELEPGRAALRKLGPTPAERAAKVKTAREQGYLAAVEALYGAGDKRTRDLKYGEAMAALAGKFSSDDEAQSFYALSLLAVLPRGDQALPLRQKAGAILEGVFARNPKHPGAAHYILHAYDHGALAAKALPAARAYTAIAPAASHALHMPAHAFVQLGLWEEAATSDRASWDASVQWAARRGLANTMRDFHSLTWLHYEWMQLGRFKEAAGALALVDEALRAVKPSDQIGGHQYMDSAIGRGIGPEALRNDRGSMRARYVIDGARWSEMQGQSTFDGIDELFALGMSAAKRGDRTRVEAAIEELRKASSPSQPAELREQAEILLCELQAIHLFAQGKQADGLAQMDRATLLQGRMPKPIGRPFPVKGADELYGELLLEAGRPQAAIEWFNKTLTRTPNRSRAVLGLARARSKAGDLAGSRQAYKQFLQNWKGADEGLAEMKEARAGAGAGAQGRLRDRGIERLIG